MATLESVVLPLAQSRSLVEHGIALDTAMVWVESPAGWNKYKVIATGDGKYFTPEAHAACPAPTLSELLDAIREKYPEAVISIFHRAGFGVDADIDDDTIDLRKGAGSGKPYKSGIPHHF